MAIALSESEKERVRYHLGYLNVEPPGSITLGFPSASQALYLVEIALERLIPSTVERVLKIVDHLDCIEMQMMEANKRLKAQQLGELKLRNSNDEATEQELLEKEYHRWARRLSDNLGVPLNPFSEKFRRGGGANAVRNVKVSW